MAALEDRLEEQLLGYHDARVPLSTVLSPNDLVRLETHPSEFVRVALAKALVYDAEGPLTVELLCRLARDPDALVRAEAMDSLSECPCDHSYTTLRQALDDPDELVRKYAAFGVGYLGRSIAPADAEALLRRAAAADPSEHAQVGIWEGLYLLGAPERLEPLLALFRSEDYQIQCSVLHALEDCLNWQNLPRILDFLNSLELSQYGRAVASTAERLLQQCNTMESQLN